MGVLRLPKAARHGLCIMICCPVLPLAPSGNQAKRDGIRGNLIVRKMIRDLPAQGRSPAARSPGVRVEGNTDIVGSLDCLRIFSKDRVLKLVKIVGDTSRHLLFLNRITQAIGELFS